MEVTINGTSVMQGNDIIGYFVYHTDTMVAVYDYRDDTGFVGFMNYTKMVSYFEGFETE